MSATIPEALAAFFRAHSRLALAFSGGADSAYLLYAATACGCDVTAYYVKSAFQPEFELEDARRLAEALGARLVLIPMDVLAEPAVRANPPDRCYHCKRAIFTALIDRARADGYDTLIDGTNASDDAGDRPGMKALRELKVLSPLRECGVTKAALRAYSREAGLFTWDKPAYACLATRIQTDQKIIYKDLKAVEECEGLMMDLGLRDFRVRVRGKNALVQIREEDLELYENERDAIEGTIMRYFKKVTLDPVFRK